MKPSFRLSSVILPVAVLMATLAGCSSMPSPAAAPATPAADTPPQWYAPLPHDGQVAKLADWWRQFDDPLLAQLIEASQAASPTIAAAAARIEQARSTRVAAGAALGPTLDANASLARGRQDTVTPLGTTGTAGLQAAWEIDVFGGNRAARDAAQARLDGAQAGWHDARVAVAADTANTYVNLRGCEAQRDQARIDADSRAETARLTGLSTKAGFESPANAALARASAAQGNNLLTQRRAQCDALVKALVALTALSEPDLRQRLAAAEARQPQPGAIGVQSVPAQALAQRPDVFAAERELLAASADVSQAQAQRLPRLTLNGNITAFRFESGGGNADGTLWQIGPLSVTLPLFDGGRRRANVDAAQARYAQAGAEYRATLRTAVREVEEALVNLQSTEARSADAQAASEGFAASFRATEARYRGGLASLFELEDARRSALQSQVQLIDLKSERSAAWIALYRALGGGWSRPEQQASAGATPAAN
jgi:multidrug efflux system outer membrane protein